MHNKLCDAVVFHAVVFHVVVFHVVVFRFRETVRCQWVVFQLLVVGSVPQQGNFLGRLELEAFHSLKVGSVGQIRIAADFPRPKIRETVFHNQLPDSLGPKAIRPFPSIERDNKRMTQLIAQLRQLTIGDGLQPSQVKIFLKVTMAFVIGLVTAAVVF